MNAWVALPQLASITQSWIVAFEPFVRKIPPWRLVAVPSLLDEAWQLRNVKPSKPVTPEPM